MANLRQSTEQYEAWLREKLGGDVVEKDLQRKHKKMRSSPFTFLRATYWRWAETVLEICPDMSDAPEVLAVGDIHLENYGSWRDVDGRLVWGVNDLDEAARMPFTLDLIRLATSSIVAHAQSGPAAGETCAAILEGYREGLKAPQPIVLDRDRGWLRDLVVVPDKERAAFWKKIDAAAAEDPPPRYRTALASAMPEKAGQSMKTARRTAGTGSLGRPRWLGIAEWRGAPVVREAKAVLTSSWYRAAGRKEQAICIAPIAGGRYRAPDPWFHVEGSVVVRRLSPNNRKIEAEETAGALVSRDMLHVMGLELANVHLGTGDHRAAIEGYLQKFPQDWLIASAEKMAAAVEREHQEWANGGSD